FCVAALARRAPACRLLPAEVTCCAPTGTVASTKRNRQSIRLAFMTHLGVEVIGAVRHRAVAEHPSVGVDTYAPCQVTPEARGTHGSKSLFIWLLAVGHWLLAETGRAS